jgi:hypothetical protein
LERRGERTAPLVGGDLKCMGNLEAAYLVGSNPRAPTIP